MYHKYENLTIYSEDIDFLSHFKYHEQNIKGVTRAHEIKYKTGMHEKELKEEDGFWDAIVFY